VKTIDSIDPAAWYASRPWTANYPSNMPRTMTVDPQETLLSLLLAACDQFPDRVAFELDDRSLTFRQWRLQAERLASFFVHEWQLQPGDRVMLMLPNLLEFPIAALAIWMADLTLMPTFAGAASQEIEGPLASIAPKAIVGMDGLMHTFRAARGSEGVRELVVSAPPALFPAAPPQPPSAVVFEDALARGANLPPVDRVVSPDSIALMAYTGGTTGISKAVLTSHANMCAGIAMLGAAMLDQAGPKGGWVVSIQPFTHASGMSVNLLQYASRGVSQLCFSNPFDTQRVVAAWNSRPIQSILAGPAFFSRWMATPGFDALDFSALRSAATGGMPLRPDISERWEARTGKPLLQGYGLTETSTPIAGEMAHARHIGSVGFPFPSVELSLRDPDAADFPAVPPGTIGEVWLRGPFVMSGYHQRPDETARVFTADGWFRTGDLGRMNESGALYLLGRIKDLILVNGDNVYPAAIEDTVGAHPGIADVCAVAMPDDDDGERVRLFVVRRDPDLDEASVAAWCQSRLSHFKQPKRIEFLDALPRSIVDKLLRRELSQRPIV
jgi:long-chain acyl-CoA synthetase